MDSPMNSSHYDSYMVQEWAAGAAQQIMDWSEENYDYTINYSQAEIIFTPKVLIHSDSDIFIEFQYSNFLYDKGFTGGTLTRELGKKGSFSLGIFHEGDQSGKEYWSQDILDSLESIDNGKIRYR